LRSAKEAIKYIKERITPERCYKLKKFIDDETLPKSISLKHFFIFQNQMEVMLMGHMSQGCSQGYKPKTGPQWTQKENIHKQRKYKYFTSLKL